MKITIEVPQKHIDGALAEPASRYWASEAVWTQVDGSYEGYVVEAYDNGLAANGPKRYELGSTKLKAALELMAKLPNPEHFMRLLTGGYDGETGDLLLQLMAFEELRYG